ncbi:beta-lactamase [Candidatus Nitromaritima sp. SCGC AAA799-C22]|nr:beta-lactamase [Candidatus Nitromaritima sp. SCGC AAA799-C22]
MDILFLGSGTSTGIPSLCCDCDVCRSGDPKNKRLRSSILIRENGSHLLVDTSTDLRQQCLQNGISHINYVLYTHHHADHVHGIDELRSFNYFNNAVIPCYGNKDTISEIRTKFDYIFNGTTQVGGGLPKLTLNTVDGEAFELGGVAVTPLNILHGRLTILGYKFNNCAYVTDCSGIPDESRDKLKGLDLLILNALGFEPHPTHFSLGQALEAVEELQPKRTILTHINHKFDHRKVSAGLPENVELAYDGMVVSY